MIKGEKMGTYKDLVVWQNSIRLVKNVYSRTSKFPMNETHGITSQIRRAAVSVPANICEGCARGSPREFRHFLRISFASLMELETLLILASEIKYLSKDDFDNLHSQIKLVTVQISRLIQSVEKEILKFPKQ